MRMANAFAALGHDVQLIARRGDMTLGEPHDYYGTSDFQIVTLEQSTLRGIRPWIYAVRALRHARTWQADVAYGRDPHALLCLSRSGVATGFELHELSAGRRARLEGRLLRQRSLRAAVFITTALEGDYLERHGFLAEVPRLVAPDGADEVEPGVMPARSDPGRAKVGYVGHLYPGRGIELIHQLAARMPDVAFEVVGGTPHDVEAHRQMARHTKNLHFVGQVAAIEVGGHLATFQIVVAPYQVGLQTARGGDTSRWMSPLKIFEYMSYGLPIVASDLPALREVLHHEQNALLVDPTDVDGWERAVRRLWNTPDLRARIGHQARTEITTTYSWRRRAQRILDALMVA
jgi:glycosyltransferase involved in cell wall biosynthesis